MFFACSENIIDPLEVLKKNGRRQLSARTRISGADSVLEGENLFYLKCTEENILPGTKELVQRVVLKGGQYAIGWILDGDVSHCMVCRHRFGAILWRHHCRFVCLLAG